MTVRSVVPAAVTWPQLVEPDHLVCGPLSAGGRVAALTSHGLGIAVSAEVAGGLAAEVAESIALHGLARFGAMRGVSWSDAGILAVLGHGTVASCPSDDVNGTVWRCQAMEVPPLPLGQSGANMLPGVVAESGDREALHAAIALGGDAVSLLELQSRAGHLEWHEVAGVRVWGGEEGSNFEMQVVAISLTGQRLSVTTRDGSVHQWALQGGRPVSTAARESPSEGGTRRTWQAACPLPNGQVVRLASRWQTKGAKVTWKPELLL